MEWQNCFGGSDDDHAYDIFATQNGYLIAGGTKSNDGNISYNHGATDCWLIKTNNTGDLIWEKTYGGSYGDGVFRIFPADGNSYYLLCSSYSSNGDISNDPYPESTDYWIVKIDSVGNIIWEKIIGGNGDDQLWTGTCTDDGGVVAIGWTASNDGDVTTYFGAYDMWMVKLNSEGAKEWDFTLGTDWFDYGQAIIQTSDGGFLVGGASAIGEGGNLTCEPFNSYAEAILVKLDADRNIEWQQCYGGSEHDGVWELLELVDGYLFVGYGSSGDGDLTGSGWHGEGDIWVVKIDFWGNIIWQKCLGGSSYESALRFFQTLDDGFIIAGRTKSQDGDVIGNHSLSEYDNDIWLVKISSEGDLLWQQCIGGQGDERLDFGIIKKSDSNFVIAGQTDFGPSYDVQCTPHSIGGIPDFWVFEIKDTTTNIIGQSDNKFGLKVYPIPAKDYVCFEYNLSSVKNESIIEIFNIQGIKVKSFILTETKGLKVWDTRQINQGMYFYQLNSMGNVLNRGKIFIVK